MTISFRPLPGAFGVELLDLDLSKNPSEAAMREVISIFYEHQFIAIRGQQLKLAEFDSFSRCFGRQRPHFLDHLRMDGHPAILMLSNIYEGNRQIGIYEGACFWHTDVAYEDPPNSATIVYSIDTPRGGGAPTCLADMFAAYDALPQGTKRAIDDLVVLHHYGNRYDTREGSPTAAERLTEDQKQRVNNVYHPLVMRHPVTGRRSLYGVAGSSFGIVGMPDDEAHDLLHELAEHATGPDFTTAYEYQPGDVACWDTYSTLHKAPGQKPAQRSDPHARLLWRVSVTGLSPLIPTNLEHAASESLAGLTNGSPPLHAGGT